MIKKITSLILIVFLGILFFLFLPKKVIAEIYSGSSATFSIEKKSEKLTRNLVNLQKKSLAIKMVLERYHSPMVDEVDSFISYCLKYDLDCYLLPSIAGLESSFGKFIYPNSYNPFGWGGGYIIFNSWDQAIEAVGKGLRENYIDKWHLLTVEEIGQVYSESPTWATRVNWFINEFKKEEEKLSLIFTDIKVE